MYRRVGVSQRENIIYTNGENERIDCTRTVIYNQDMVHRDVFGMFVQLESHNDPYRD